MTTHDDDDASTPADACSRVPSAPAPRGTSRPGDSALEDEDGSPLPSIPVASGPEFEQVLGECSKVGEMSPSKVDGSPFPLIHGGCSAPEEALQVKFLEPKKILGSTVLEQLMGLRPGQRPYVVLDLRTEVEVDTLPMRICGTRGHLGRG